MGKNGKAKNKGAILKSAFHKYIEYIVISFSLILFLMHLALIFLVNAGYLDIQLLDSESYISAISTPFTVIIFYEIFRLALSFSKPIIYSLILQFEVVSLIYVRNIFKIFAGIDLDAVTQIQQLVIRIIYIIIISIVLFVAAKIITRLIKGNKRLVKEEPEAIKGVKKILSYLLVAISLGTILYNTFDFSSEFLIEILTNEFKLTAIFKSIFSIMIIVDIINFIFTFFYNDTYSEAFRHAVYIVAAIIIRLAITVSQPFDLILVFVGVSTTILITWFQIKVPEDC